MAQLLSPDGTLALPAPAPVRRPRLIAYQRLIVAVVLINLGALWYALARGGWSVDDGSALSGLASLTLLNLAAGRADPAAESAQRALRAGRPRLAVVAAVAALGHLERASRRRDPRRRRAVRDRVAVRVRRRGGRGAGRSHDARAHRLPRRPAGAGGRVRGAGGARPRAQRLRALAPLRRLDRDRAVLGAHHPPRAGGAGLAGRVGARGRGPPASPRRGCGCAGCR